MQVVKKIGEAFLLACVCFLLFVLLFEERIHLPVWVQVIGRMHPMLLHFPIVLLLLYFLTLWLPLKESDTWVDGVGLLAALSAVITAITGFLLSFQEEQKGSTFFWHKWGGISIAILAFLLYHLHPYLKRRKLLARPITVFISIVVIMTGHWGAGLTHGEDYLMEPISATSEREAVPLEQAVAFQHIIQPILTTKCMGCHGKSSTKGGLAMHDTTLLLEGGKTGPLFIAGQPENSLLIKRILLPVDDKKHMVPKTKPQLTEAEIHLLAAWIKSGAPLQQKIIDLPAKDSFRILAASLLSPSSPQGEGEMTYNFASADESEIKALNNNYRLVTPLGENSPALSVQFYGKNGYSTKALEELLQVKEQIAELSLAKLPVKDDDLKIIGQLHNLKKLNLNYTDVTDKGLVELTALKQLQKLSLAGTAISPGIAAQLLKLPELTTMYIWDTKLNNTEVAALQKRYPNIKLETGYKDDGLTILPLNPPLAKTAPGVYDSSVQIELKHSYKGAEIRYTLDGTEPDSVNSNLYKEPLKMEQFTVVKAKAFKPGWYGSKPLKAVYFRKGIKPDSVVLVTNEKENKGKDKLLFDAEIGDGNLGSGKWLRFKEAVTYYLFFKEPVTVRQVRLNAFVRMEAYVFHPAKVEVWGSLEKTKMKLLNTLREAPPEKDDEQGMVQPKIDFAAAKLKYIKLVIYPLSAIPAWHPKLNPAKAHISEVFLY